MTKIRKNIQKKKTTEDENKNRELGSSRLLREVDN